MGRGFLAGFLAGTALALVAGGAASVLILPSPPGALPPTLPAPAPERPVPLQVTDAPPDAPSADKPAAASPGIPPDPASGSFVTDIATPAPGLPPEPAAPPPAGIGAAPIADAPAVDPAPAAPSLSPGPVQDTLPVVAEPMPPAPVVLPDDRTPPVHLVHAGEFIPDGRPLLSIVLLAGQDPQFDAPDVPLTIVLDEGEGLAEAYRLAGHEVVLSQREGATAEDLSRRLAADRSSVAVLDLNGSIASDPGMREAVANSSRGLLLLQDTREYAADLPVAVATRRMEATETTPRQLAQALDRVAYAAAQQGTAILLAPATAEMLIALREWSGTDTARRVALAPLSAILLRDQ